jgi:hypothetical protein
MNCKTCAGPCCLKGSNIEGDCENYVPWTNASRIRAMSDEELAEFLEMIPHCGGPATYTTDGFCIDDGLRTKSQWLDWLRREDER